MICIHILRRLTQEVVYQTHFSKYIRMSLMSLTDQVSQTSITGTSDSIPELIRSEGPASQNVLDDILIKFSSGFGPGTPSFGDTIDLKYHIGNDVHHYELDSHGTRFIKTEPETGDSRLEVAIQEEEPDLSVEDLIIVFGPESEEVFGEVRTMFSGVGTELDIHVPSGCHIYKMCSDGPVYLGFDSCEAYYDENNILRHNLDSVLPTLSRAECIAAIIRFSSGCNIVGYCSSAMVDVQSTLNTFEYKRFLKQFFFPVGRAPITWEKYTSIMYESTHEVGYVYDVAHCLLRATKDDQDVHYHEIGMTMAVVGCLMPIMVHSKNLTKYPEYDTTGEFFLALDQACAVFGHRACSRMLDVANIVGRDYGAWMRDLTDHADIPGQSEAELSSIARLHKMARNVHDASRIIAKRMEYNLSQISELAEFYKDSGYVEIRDGVRYVLVKDHGFWFMRREDGTGKGLPFLAFDAFNPSN